MDGATCHYCQKYKCECPDDPKPVPSESDIIAALNRLAEMMQNTEFTLTMDITGLGETKATLTDVLIEGKEPQGTEKIKHQSFGHRVLAAVKRARE